MTNKSAKKLFNYIYDSLDSSVSEIYLIHYINSDGDVYTVDKIEWVEDEGGYLFHLKSDYLIQEWAESIDESEIFVYKLINWNKI